MMTLICFDIRTDELAHNGHYFVQEGIFFRNSITTYSRGRGPWGLHMMYVSSTTG